MVENINIEIMRKVKRVPETAQMQLIEGEMAGARDEGLVVFDTDV